MTEWYVNPAHLRADDFGLGYRLDSPFKSLSQANEVAVSGDRVLVYPASYAESLKMAADGVEWICTEPGVIVDSSHLVDTAWTNVSGDLWSTPLVGTTTAGGITVDDYVFSFPALTSGSTSYDVEEQNKVVTNAFLHDRVGTGLLYLNLGGADPNDHVVRAFTANGVWADSKTDLYLEGFHVQGANGYNIRLIGGANHVIRKCSATRGASGGIRFEAPTPQLFKPADSGAGSLAAGTYTWQVTAIVGGVETLPGFGNTITLSVGSRQVFLEWAGVVGATSYKLYGRGATGRLLIATIAAPVSGFPNYTDNGTVTPAGASVPADSTIKCFDSLMDECHTWQQPSHGQALFAAERCTIRAGRTHHNALHGVSLQMASHENIIELCRSYLNKRLDDRIANGIQVDAFGIGTPGSERCKVRRNILYRNDDSGVSIYQHSDDCEVTDNLLYLNGDHGGDTFNAERVHWINNTAYGNVAAGIQAEGDNATNASQGARIYNCVSVDNGVNSPRTSGNYRIDSPTSADAEIDYCLSYLTVSAADQPGPGSNGEITWGAGGGALYRTLADFRAAVPAQMANSVSADPRFMDPEHGDFRLGFGSAAVGIGSDLVDSFDDRDMVGTLEPSPPDAGCLVRVD